MLGIETPQIPINKEAAKPYGPKGLQMNTNSRVRLFVRHVQDRVQLALTKPLPEGWQPEQVSTLDISCPETVVIAERIPLPQTPLTQDELKEWLNRLPKESTYDQRSCSVSGDKVEGHEIPRPGWLSRIVRQLIFGLLALFNKELRGTRGDLAAADTASDSGDKATAVEQYRALRGSREHWLSYDEFLRALSRGIDFEIERSRALVAKLFVAEP
jgi:hypothetical protein